MGSICGLFLRKSRFAAQKSRQRAGERARALEEELGRALPFLQELAKSRPHAITYRGESFAGFGQLIFDSLCTVDARQPPTYLERQAVLARCRGKCEMCKQPLWCESYKGDGITRPHQWIDAFWRRDAGAAFGSRVGWPSWS